MPLMIEPMLPMVRPSVAKALMPSLIHRCRRPSLSAALMKLANRVATSPMALARRGIESDPAAASVPMPRMIGSMARLNRCCVSSVLPKIRSKIDCVPADLRFPENVIRVSFHTVPMPPRRRCSSGRLESISVLTSVSKPRNMLPLTVLRRSLKASRLSQTALTTAATSGPSFSSAAFVLSAALAAADDSSFSAVMASVCACSARVRFSCALTTASAPLTPFLSASTTSSLLRFCRTSASLRPSRARASRMIASSRSRGPAN